MPAFRKARRGQTAIVGDDRPARVLILTASMGAGHDGAARELAARLRHDGHEAEVHDFYDAIPLHVGGLVKRSYELEMRYASSTYDAAYRLLYRAPWLCSLLTWLVSLATSRRVRRWTRRFGADVVVSTYPLATRCLGRMRTLGRLRIPTVNFITDFGVHPLWVHKGVDLNLAVHAGPAEAARRRTGRPAIACGPLVGTAFGPPPAATRALREATRSALGLGPEDRAVLVVAGSLGLGHLEDTFAAVAATGRYVPVVVCGRDQAARLRLERLARSTSRRAVILGWNDNMPGLMAACDALIENAGGLTSLEAMRAGLPVISYQPIAGHGRENTAAMAAAGVSRLAADAGDLVRALDLVTVPGPARRTQVEAGHGMFVANGASLVLDTARRSVVTSLVRPNRARVLWASTSRRVAGVAIVGALLWGGMTTGVGVAAGAGAGVAHPMPDVRSVTYVGVRLDVPELDSPAVDKDIETLGVTVVVDRMTALEATAALDRLAAAGVNIENGGQGLWLNQLGQPYEPTLWTRAHGDVAAAKTLSTLIHQPVRLFVPGRRVNGFDLIDTSKAHESLVVANEQINVGVPHQGQIPTLAAKKILLVGGLDAQPSQLLTALRHLTGRLERQRLAPLPLTALT